MGGGWHQGEVGAALKGSLPPRYRFFSVVAAAALASTAEPTLLAQLKRFTDHPFHCAFLFVSGIPCHLPVEGIFQRRPISPGSSISFIIHFFVWLFFWIIYKEVVSICVCVCVCVPVRLC